MLSNTLDGVKMLHHDEMRNYDRIQGKLVSVIMNHGCKIIETPSFEDYDVYQHYFPSCVSRWSRPSIRMAGPILRPDVTVPSSKRRRGNFPGQPAPQIRL